MALAIFLACCGTAQAGHPLATDDTGTQGMLKFQVESTAEFGWDKETLNGTTTKTNQQNLGLTLTAGIFDSLDASIAIPFTIQQIKENDIKTLDNNGLSDITLALKWRFLELGPLSLAIKPAMTIPNGDEAKSLGNGRAIYTATLISTVDLKPVLIHANLSYVHQEYVDAVRPDSPTDLWKMSLAGSVFVLKGLQVVAEVGTGVNNLKASDVWPTYITGGLIYSVNDQLDFDLGVRGGLNKPSTDLALLTGVVVRFP
jgi:hypothetical protein